MPNILVPTISTPSVTFIRPRRPTGGAGLLGGILGGGQAGGLLGGNLLGGLLGGATNILGGVVGGVLQGVTGLVAGLVQAVTGLLASITGGLGTTLGTVGYNQDDITSQAAYATQAVNDIQSKLNDLAQSAADARAQGKKSIQ